MKALCTTCVISVMALALAPGARAYQNPQGTASKSGNPPDRCSGPSVAERKSDTDNAARKAAGADLSEARELVSHRELASAEAALLRSLSDSPTADAWYELGAVRFARADPVCSLAAFTTAAALRPPRGEDLRLVALDYVLLHDSADAERWLHIAVQQDPQNGEAWYDLGRALYEQKRYDEAATALRHALSLTPQADPQRARALTYLGLIAETQNEMQRAETDYRAAIHAEAGANQPFFLPFRALGVLLRDAGKLQEATTLLQRAVELAPGDAASHAELADCFSKEGRWPAAQEELLAAIRLHPSRPAWHFKLGRAYQALGRKQDAAREFALAKSEIDVAPPESPDR